MDIKEWIDRYEDKAEKYMELEGHGRVFDEDKGFIDYIILDGPPKTLFIDHTSINDFDFFCEWIHRIAKEKDCKQIITFTTRNPAAYVRWMKGHAHLNVEASRTLGNGKWYWYFEEEL